jgi:hypothetical protein
MKKYKIDLGDDEFVEIPHNLAYQIIVDHLNKSYHWVFGTAGIIIGFLLGIIATR